MSGVKSTARRPEDRRYFFENGLRFGCTQCGHCCTGAPGTVMVNEAEAARIASHLGVSVETFYERYTKAVKGGRSMRESKPDYACIFFQRQRCSIYEVRPTQCRTYPFWAENVRSETAWLKTCRDCPGIGSGRLYDREEIVAMAAASLDTGALDEGTGPQPEIDTAAQR